MNKSPQHQAPPPPFKSLEKPGKGTLGSHSDGSCTLNVFAPMSSVDVTAPVDALEAAASQGVPRVPAGGLSVSEVPVECCGEFPEWVERRGWVLVRCVVCRKAVMTRLDGVRVWNQTEEMGRGEAGAKRG